MTICIAAVCRGYDQQNVLVLCSDNRISQAGWGSSDASTKLHSLGWNWAAMMAGDWDITRELSIAIEKDFTRNGKVKAKPALLRRVRKATAKFAASDLCEPAVRCQLLITGFIDDEAIMLWVWIETDRASGAKLVHDFYAIGEGDAPAMYMLRHRHQNPLRSTVEETVYHIYEAKKFSEVVDSVGPTTRLVIHTPEPAEFSGHKRDVCIMRLSAHGLRNLESLHQKFSFQPVDIQPFPGDYFD